MDPEAQSQPEPAKSERDSAESGSHGESYTAPPQKPGANPKKRRFSLGLALSGVFAGVALAYHLIAQAPAPPPAVVIPAALIEQGFIQPQEPVVDVRRADPAPAGEVESRPAPAAEVEPQQAQVAAQDPAKPDPRSELSNRKAFKLVDTPNPNWTPHLQASVGPQGQKLSCGLPQTSSTGGGDSNAVETKTYPLSSNNGYLTLAWEMYGVPDRIEVVYEGRVLYDSGCKGGPGSIQVSYYGMATTADVRIYPNCAGTIGTAWNFSLCQ